jgi:DNA-binding response OmpR family regulator
MTEDSTSRKSGLDLDDIQTTERHKILIVDDDFDNITLLKHVLRSSGFDVMSADNGRDGLKKVAEKKPDLVLLDWLMPGIDGRETFANIRKVSDVPVIFISALDEKTGIVNVLLDGVDDYITKPFFNPEVVARIKSVLRRAEQDQAVDRLIFPETGLIIDFSTQEVILGESKIQLTQKEFEVLGVLSKGAPRVVNYQTITETIWGEDNPEARKRAKYLIYLLRKKFNQVSPEQNLIINIDRLGYKLQAE